MRYRIAYWALFVPLILWSVARSGPVGANEPEPAAEGCAAAPALELQRPLDFGDLRLQRGRDGYVSVTPRGEVLAADSVLVRVEPMPGEFRLCGPAYAVVVLELEALERDLNSPAGPPAARRFTDVSLGGEGLDLERRGPGEWRGVLGESGRAVVRMGGTLILRGSGAHGEAGTDMRLHVYLE